MPAPFDQIAVRWQGQAEYFANTAQGPIGAAHAVVPLVIQIDSGGKITGESTENGCQILGLVTTGSSTMNFRVRASLTHCRPPLLNRRYQGQIAHYVKNGTLGFGLTANSTKPATQYNVSSTLMR